MKGHHGLRKCYSFLLRDEPKSASVIDCFIYHQTGGFCFHKPLLYYFSFPKQNGCGERLSSASFHQPEQLNVCLILNS